MLGKRLVGLRKIKNLTQQQVADDLKISRGTYGHYEIGRREPDFDTLEKIADYFNVTTDYLLGRSAYAEFERQWDEAQTESMLQKLGALGANRFVDKYGKDAFERLVINQHINRQNSYNPKISELLDISLRLTPVQLDAVLTVAKAMVGPPISDTKNKVVAINKQEPTADPIAKLPFWNQRLKALRVERGLSLEEAAAAIAAQTNNFLTADKLQAYEEDRAEIEPSHQAAIVTFYQTSWGFISGRTNDRTSAGPAPFAMEIAHRIDDIMQPLSAEAEKGIDELKKKRGLYYDKKGEDENPE